MTDKQEFSLAQVTTGSPKPAKVPKICPRCSQSATEPTKILAYNFEPSTGEMIMPGLLGQLFRFAAIGWSESRVLLTVKICRSCHASWKLHKALEWISRVAGIGLSVILLTNLSTPERPLAQQGMGMILLTLSPLVIGAILSYFFRSLSDRSKGVVFVRAEGGRIWFRVESANWLRDFLIANPKKDSEAKPNTY